ncbi:MAG: efflux RND transporter permease subunit, partial [Candidatus Omnitrophota bacterium]
MNLPLFSIKRPVTIWMIFSAIILLGIISINRIPVELFPSSDPLKITIFTPVRGGMPPEEIENLVTKPIEAAISTAFNLEEITSQSRQGRATVTLTFQSGTDMDFALLGVREKFNEIKKYLPKEIEKSVIARYQELDSYVMILAASSTFYSSQSFAEIITGDIKGQLLRLDGVANVDIYGAQEPKVMVEVDKGKLLKYGLSINDVLAAINTSNASFLLGETEDSFKKYSIRAQGKLSTINDIKNVCLGCSSTNSMIKVKDIAVVKEDCLDRKMYSRFFKKGGRSKEVVSLYIHKESQANTIKVCRLLRKKIEELKKSKFKHVNIEIVLDKSSVISEAIGKVKGALLLGAVFAALILYLFFRNIKITLIVVLTIPVCLFAAVALMFLYKGLTFNVLSLSGLALGIGMVIDSAIIVTENITRKREENNSFKDAVITGTKEVWPVIFTSTITTVIVFLPLILNIEEIRRRYSNLALSVIFSLAVSLITAVSLVPSLIYRIKVSSNRRGKLNRLTRLYVKLLSIILSHPKKCVLAALVFLLSAIFILPLIKKDFLTDINTNKFTIFTRLETGAKTSRTDKITKEVESVLENTAQVQSFTSRIDGWSSRIYVELSSESAGIDSINNVITTLRPKLKNIENKYRGGFIYFSSLGRKFPELAINVYGHDYNKLNFAIENIVTKLSSIEGLLDWKKSIEDVAPEYRIIVDKQKAASFLFDTRGIAQTLHSQMRGMRATLFREESKERETVVRLKKEDRDTFLKIKHLTLSSPLRKNIYLNQLCGFEMGTGPAQIDRKNKNRYIQISALSSKLSLSELIPRVQTALKNHDLETGYYWEFAQDYKTHIKTRKQLIIILTLSIMLVYMVLASLFESYGKPFIIMLSIPFAYAGVLWVIFLFGMPIEIGAVMGLIILSGIVVNNSIIIVDKINSLKGKRKLSKSILIRAGVLRLRPIFITTITT